MVLPDIEKRIIQLEKRNKVLEEMVHELTLQVLDREEFLFTTGEFLAETSKVVVAMSEYLGDDFKRFYVTYKYNTES